MQKKEKKKTAAQVAHHHRRISKAKPLGYRVPTHGKLTYGLQVFRTITILKKKRRRRKKKRNKRDFGDSSRKEL